MTTYALPLRSGAIELVPSVLDLGAEVMYATIVDSVVTAITFGTLPASDSTTYYVDISAEDPAPLVDWYFNDDCQTFSATPPVIPAGEIAPPYTPGGTPPDPDGPSYPPTELPPGDDPTPLADTIPFPVSFHADGVDSLPVTGGSDFAEVNPLMRTIIPAMEDVCAARIQAHIDTADAALDLFLCYSEDGGTTWLPLSPGGTGPSLTLAALGTLAGSYRNIDPALAGDVLVNVCTTGSGTAVVGNVLGLFYYKISDGLCVEIAEGGCVPPADYPIFSDDFSAYATYADFITARYYSADPDFYNLFSDLYLNTTEDYWHSLDSSTVLPGGTHSLKSVIQDDSGTLYYGIAWITQFENEESDVTIQWVGLITAGADFASTFNGVPIADVQIGSTGSETQFGPGYGMIMFSLEDKAPPGEGGSRYFHEISIRDDRVYYDYRVGSAYQGSPLDIGAAADLIGANKQITVRCDYLSTTAARILVYVDDACPDNPTSPTLWATINPGGNRISNSSLWRSNTMWNATQADPPDTPSEATVHTFYYSYNPDSTLYGL